MTIIGHVASLWRYPVKSMRGESLREARIDAGGIEGDRRFAFRGSLQPEHFPYFTAREQPAMLLHRPRIEGSGVIVEMPAGDQLAIDDPALVARLGHGRPQGETVTLMRDDAAIADCHPLSLLSLQTARQLGAEIGTEIDARRFRANIYLDLSTGGGFAEDAFVGRALRIGGTVVVAVVARDSRCAMITLDPDTAAPSPAVLAKVATAHQGNAGVYAGVQTPGVVRVGDPVVLIPA